VLNLNEKELDSLIHFFSKEDIENDTANLQQLLTDEIEHFRVQETSLTKEDASGIAQPSGSLDCDLGLILHCQSREGGVTQFWDKGSQTIQLLSKKGLGCDVALAYDWHWSGEGQARGRKSTCPASSWEREKLLLHNQLSHRLLEILPLPFLVVAGGCAKKHYQESKKYSIKELNIKLKDNISITSEILFEAQSVRRVTAFVDHPAATMFNPTSAAKYCLRLDSTLNFFMWLLAVPHNEMSFTETAARIQKGKPGSAPLAEVHEYVKREATLGRTLTVLEYEPDFLCWASRTLKEDVFKILDAGRSVAKMLRTKINKSISESLQDSSKFAAANRRRNADRYGFEFKEFWDAEEVTVLAQGYVSLHLSQETRALKFFLPLKARTKCLAAQKKNKKAVIFFTKTGVELRLEGESILTRTIDELEGQRSFGQDLVDQHRKELARKAAIAREKGRGEKNMSLDQLEE
jgi:hypothetical protein